MSDGWCGKVVKGTAGAVGMRTGLLGVLDVEGEGADGAAINGRTERGPEVLESGLRAQGRGYGRGGTTPKVESQSRSSARSTR
jgi:hypothetical protein